MKLSNIIAKATTLVSNLSVSEVTSAVKEINTVMGESIARDKSLGLARSLMLTKLAYDSKGAGAIESAVIGTMSAIDLKKAPLALYALGPVKTVLTYKRKGFVRSFAEDIVFGFVCTACIGAHQYANLDNNGGM